MCACISENVEKIKRTVSKNPYGENVYILAATKTRSVEEIRISMESGVDYIGENRVQEFLQKCEFFPTEKQHFIGRLQTNKVKYLIGRVALIHSCDRDELADEISRQSEKKGVTTDVLVEVNIGGELSKGGYSYVDAERAYERIKNLPFVRVRGFMAMLPALSEKERAVELVKKMRALYDKVKAEDKNVSYLSMGMSADYLLCVENGSNLVRIGEGIFGARNYGKKAE